MDFSTLLGIVAAFGLMLMAIMSGSGIMVFVEPQSIMIVAGGTLGALLVHYPFGEVRRAFSVAQKTFFYKEVPPLQLIEQLTEFAGKARKEGLLSLQAMAKQVEDPFLVKGLQMAADGHEPEALEHMMVREIDYIRERHESGAEIFAALGTYAPAIGMVGTLIGLVQMLQSMDDPSTIGPAMAIALLTTFYGSVAANVIFLPMSGKLKTRSQHELLKKELIVEGMNSILAGENPRVMEQKLHAYLQPKDRQSVFQKKKKK
ncbi:chemotaxis protein MotA [Desulfosalsimonas propionicica]|uniref:Chemotaxis protein MotA n=1 Tax=Desulfosalsimonas propionicica TaxID=332175 RepID=A0A7W0C8U7_9BACT|nr:MotA/TolQ/ExbB proton channel family protein [Desulfosalsimonas propionicica]MBA2881306.1 chemotaxis protein MotA [Desulfosalsimonas propionicica]